METAEQKRRLSMLLRIDQVSRDLAIDAVGFIFQCLYCG